MKSNSIQGKTFAFIGGLSQHGGRSATELVVSHGGCVQARVDSNIDFLVVGSRAGSRMKKAHVPFTLEVQILAEDEFIEMLGIGDELQK